MELTMKWPRGKYNGQRIVGIEVRIKIDILKWWWQLSNRHGWLRIFIGPVHIWIEANYENR